MSRLGVDVTIVSSQERLLEQCLRSLYATTSSDRVDLIVRVLWNGTGRGLGPLPESFRSRYPHVLFRDEPLNGYARSQNALLADCTQRYVALANDDLVFHPDTIEKAARCLHAPEHGDVAMVGVRTLHPDGRLYPTTYSVPTPERALVALSDLGGRFGHTAWWRWLARATSSDGANRSWPHDRTMEVRAFGGALMMVRRSTLNSIGLLDVVNLGGVEEVEWQTRMRRAGWRLIFLADAEVVHLGGQTTGLDPNRDRESFLGYLNFFWKHGDTFACVRFGLGSAGWFGARALLAMIRRRPNSRLLARSAADGVRFTFRAARRVRRGSYFP